ncbi:MAG: M56 family metallopeptidase, partial [Bdellovibrionales bacterium]|nr:M56 family metallopeptidase [Bdellovibrionales bacterium]
MLYLRNIAALFLIIALAPLALAEGPEHELFTKWMQNPEARVPFEKLQRHYLVHPMDKAISEWMFDIPELKEEAQKSVANSFQNLNFASTIVALPLSMTRFKNIEKAIRRVAENLGLSKETEIKVFASAHGSAESNAVVFGNRTGMTIIIGEKILSEQTESQISAIVAHEMGHALSNASLITTAISILSETIFRLFTGEIKNPQLNTAVARLLALPPDRKAA